MSVVTWIIVVLIVALLLALILRKSSDRGGAGTAHESAARGASGEKRPHVPKANTGDDHDRWVRILREEKPRTQEFELFGTPATVLWKENDPEVSVVCITQFAKGIPKTTKYDHFEFNIKEWYWYSTVPRGAADVIKSKLEELFRSRSREQGC